MGQGRSKKQTKKVGVDFLYIYIRIYIIFPYAFLFTNSHDYDDIFFFSPSICFFISFFFLFFFFPARVCVCVSVCGCFGVGFFFPVIFMFLFSPGGGIATQAVAERRAGSVQAAAPQVVGNDDVGDRVKNHLDVVRVCGTRHVAVNLLVGGAVFALELCLDVGGRILVGVGTCGQSGVRPEGRVPPSRRTRPHAAREELSL